MQYVRANAKNVDGYPAKKEYIVCRHPDTAENPICKPTDSRYLTMVHLTQKIHISELDLEFGNLNLEFEYRII